MRTGLWIAIGMAASIALTAGAQNKDSITPMALDAGFGRMDLNPPAIPPEKIIEEFAAKESEIQEALSHYTYRRTARIQTLDDDGKVDGEYFQVDDVVFDSKGVRTEKVVFAPQNTLSRISMSPSDLQDLQTGYNFSLNKQDIGQYDVKYVGKQKVDEIECYAFDVSPKIIEKKKRYLLGRVWVDATDLQIVVTNGHMVPDDTRKNDKDLHPPFMTWRQQVDGHYWFPVYSKGEGILHFAGGRGYMSSDVHLRQVVKYSDYKRFGSTTTILYNGQEIPAAGSQPAPETKPPQ